MASAPSLEGLSQWIKYSWEKEEIENTDFSGEIDTPENIMVMVAKQRGISVEQYRKELSDKVRDHELEELGKKYGFIEPDDEVDERLDLIKKYQAASEKMTSGKTQTEKLHKFLTRPDTEPDPEKRDS